MFNKEDILAELAAGKSIEQIAQEAADTINAAKAQHDKEVKAREEAARKEAEDKRIKKEKKEKDVTGIMNSMIDFMGEFYPSFIPPHELAELRRTFNPAAFIEAMDETMKMMKELPTVEDALAKAKPNEPVKVTLSEKESKELENALDKFLRENGLF